MTRARRLAYTLVLAAVLGEPSGPIRAQALPTGAEHDAQVAQLAIETAGRGPAKPIPLFGEGSRALGAVYDQFALGVQLARNAIGAGQSSDPDAIVGNPAWKTHAIVVVAYPIDCDGKPDHPVAIRVKPRLQLPVPVRQVGDPVRGSAAADYLPGVTLPDDALVVRLQNAPTSFATVEIDYASPFCHGAATTASMPITPTLGTLAGPPVALKLPAQLSTLKSPTTVRMHVILDPVGHVRFPMLAQGPPELEEAAKTALMSRTFSPATTNGAPTIVETMATFVFTTTGAPAPADPFVPPSGSGVMTTTTTVTTLAPSPTAMNAPPVAPPAPGLIDTQLAQLALEVAAKGEPTPVPLDLVGPARHGVIYDKFLLGVLRARAASAAGTPPAASSALLGNTMMVVVFPITCEGRTIAASDIHVAATSPRLAELPVVNMLRDAALASRLPGATLPPGAVGAEVGSAAFTLNLEVRVSYAEPACGTSSTSAVFPIQYMRGTGIAGQRNAKLPDTLGLAAPAIVQMRGLVDLTGAYRFPTIAGGPDALSATAATIASNWRFEPFRANGVPIPISVTSPLAFTATGQPVPPGSAPSPTALPPVMSTSTVNGRSTEDFTTPDVPSLGRPTSQCEISSDSTYAFDKGAAVKIGGGDFGGPARERRYLAVLRGPQGQGLHVVRRGSIRGDDGTILDLYELAYAGAPAPLRIFLDEYHEGTLEAPQGLLCAAPIAVK